MKNNILLFAILSLANLTSFSQQTIKDSALETKLFKPYNNFFSKDREWVYTHFNKSAYIQGDDIWFTSYILSPTNKQLSFQTSKLYVELWAPDKSLVSRKILFVQGGTTNHFMQLGDSLAPGTYCFRAYTNWMRNFYEDQDYNTYITVLGHTKVLESGLKVNRTNSAIAISTSKEGNKLLSKKIEYDIQFLPESGHFLEGIDNVLGIKATDPNGKGVIIKGSIFNADNQEVTTFETNSSGMENITIPESSSKQYIAKIELLDGSTRDIILPKTESKGVIIHINPYRPDVVWFKIQTNEATRLLNQSYFVMIHANGVIYNNYRITLSKESAIQFRLKKKDLGKGVLYATIFNETLSPVAERIFYVQDSIQKGKLTFNTEALSNDSVKLNLLVADSLNNPRFAKMSISILPEGSTQNKFTNSLLAESILHPVLKGTIENANSYFEKNDISHYVAIDNLMLTQGWRKYDWTAILKNGDQKYEYPFEQGFSIEGKVKNWLKNKPELKSKIAVLSPQNKIFVWAPVDSVGEFQFYRVHLADSTSVIISASSDKGKQWNRVLQVSIPETRLGVPVFKQPVAIGENTIEQVDNIPKLTKGVIRLQEVVIKGKKKDPFADNIYIGIMSRSLELTKDNYMQYTTLELLLMSYFNVRTEYAQDGTVHFNMGRGAGLTTGEPQMLIDGMPVSDAQELLNFPMNLIEAVAVNKDGFGGGSKGAFGTIAIKSRTTPLFENNAEATNLKKIFVKGYATPKKYFEPKYLIQPGTDDYEKYAAIHWEPNVITDTTSRATIKFHVAQEIKTVTLRAEGISVDGLIFLHEQKIALPGRK